MLFNLYLENIMQEALHNFNWTLKAESERRIAAFEMKFFRRILKISYRDHITNISVMQPIIEAAGPQELLLTTVKRQKLQWFGHSTRYNTLAKHILQGTANGGRKRGRPKQMYTDNIREWIFWSHRNYVMLPRTIPDGERSLWKPPSAHPYDRPGQGMSE